MNEAKQRGRLAKATAIVVAAALAIAGACMATSAGHAAASQDGGKLKGIWGSVQAGLTLEEALQKEGIMKVTRENAPYWLEEEVMSLDDMEQAIADERFEVLWFTRDGSADDASSYVRSCLEGRGWTTCGIEED